VATENSGMSVVRRTIGVYSVPKSVAQNLWPAAKFRFEVIPFLAELAISHPRIPLRRSPREPVLASEKKPAS
jgi:hypothetical protein